MSVNEPPRPAATYARATLGYDNEHERALLEAITEAIFTASKVSDCNAVVIRTGEAAEALLTALAGILAMSPSATRSPTALRRTIDEFGKRLRRRVASAEQDLDLKEFVRRSFWNTGEGGKGRGRGSKQSGKRHEPWPQGASPGAQQAPPPLRSRSTLSLRRFGEAAVWRIEDRETVLSPTSRRAAASDASNSWCGKPRNDPAAARVLGRR